MVKVQLFFLTIVMSTSMAANSIYMDLFHALRKRTVIRYEHLVDLNESILVGYNNVEFGDSSITLLTTNIEGSYRRYFNDTTKGIYYSLGFRFGSLCMNDGDNSETDYLLMPFYDVGIKTELNKTWAHVLSIEVGYLIAYTKDITINSKLGLNTNVLFSFIYKLN